MAIARPRPASLVACNIRFEGGTICSSAKTLDSSAIHGPCVGTRIELKRAVVSGKADDCGPHTAPLSLHDVIGLDLPEQGKLEEHTLLKSVFRLSATNMDRPN